MTHTWPAVLSALTARRDLEPGAVRWAMGEILDGQASHLLGSLGRANALAIVPPGEEQPAGAVVDVVPLEPADGWAHAWGSVHDHPRT